MATDYTYSAVNNPVVAWMRERIRGLVEAQLAPGRSILEINAGSGVDATYFAERGYYVRATDIAPGMLAAIAGKAQSASVGGRLTWASLAFDDLSQLGCGPYDVVFSNLGGLNCTGDLEAVTRGLPSVLKPGGAEYTRLASYDIAGEPAS